MQKAEWPKGHIVGLLTSIGHFNDNEMTEHGIRLQIPPLLTERQVSSKPLVASVG